MKTKIMSRRDFLKSASFSAAFMLGGGMDLFGQRSFGLNPSFSGLKPLLMGDEPFVPEVEMSITAGKKEVQILSGAKTQVWSYEGKLLTGSGATVTALPDNYLGPILRVKSGTKVRIYFYNSLGEKSVLHPHGLRVPEECDGQPMQAIDSGPDPKIYDFQVIDRASPAWFHPHPMGRTAEQVMMGLAGLFYVWDDQEALTVPGADTGANDIPVIIQDRNFDTNNQFLYNPNQMWGYLGNKILVNGKPNTTLSLEPRAYRLRFLNGSNARTYKLSWSNGMAMKVIGTDGGLLPAAASRPYLMLMPGERADVWADFSGSASKQVILRSLSFNPGGMMGGGGGMMGGMTQSSGMDGGSMGGGGCNCGGGGGSMMGSSLANGAAFNILTVNVGRRATSNPQLGLFPNSEYMNFLDPSLVSTLNPYPVTLAMQHMVWTLNGRVYNMDDMTEVAEDEMFPVDTPLAWEWINSSPIPHPMHIHSVQFQVVKRTSPGTSSYATANQGFVDSGWKDTVIVWPGERVKIAMKFIEYTGMYMYHCHILEHEDMTMMRNIMVMESGMSMS